MRWADEIIVVDAGSEDTTLAVAQRYTNKIFLHHEWLGFGKQRQIAQGHATGDWVLMIDADECFTPELTDVIRRVVPDDDHGRVAMLSFILVFWWLYSSWWLVF